MKQLKNKLTSDRSLLLILSFVLPVIGMLCIFFGNHIYPFGDRCFLRTDLYHQYAPFSVELFRKMREGGSMFYTWNIGMGTNFLSLIGYYLSSFSNLLLILCSEDHVIEFISYMVIFKMGLSGMTFSMLLLRRSPEVDFRISFFSLFYAMSGYLAAYSWNIMWMDCIWLAPLILLGIERLVHDGKYMLYIVTLALAILSNYYIAIMLCMFCVLYFLIQIPDIFSCKVSDTPDSADATFSAEHFRTDTFSDTEAAAEPGILSFASAEPGVSSSVSTEPGISPLASAEPGWSAFWMAVLRFALSSLMAGALSAVILIPEIKALGLTASSNINFPKDWNAYFSIIEMLGRHLIDVAAECGLDHWPNIYCGVGVLVCLPLYYYNKRISAENKLAKTILLFFMLFSFSVNVPNFIWHGFHYPNSLPCRQSFLYIALVLVMCYEGFQQLEEYSSQIAGTAFAIGIGFVVLCQSIIDDDAFKMQSFWLSLLFLGIYLLFMVLYKNRRANRMLLFILMIITVSVESICNMVNTSVTTVSRSEYLNYKDPYQELIHLAQERNPDFYRFEKVARKTKNDGAFVGYPSISTFSSVSYGDMSDFYEKLGMESSMNAYSNNGITPLMNALLDVRYILTTTSQQESQLMALYEQNEDCYLYENLYNMALGFMLPKGIGLDWDLEDSTPIDLQNDFSYLCGGEQLFYEIYDSTINGKDMDIKVDEYCHVFVQLDDSRIETVDADISGTTKNFTHTNRGFLLDLGYCAPEDVITVTCKDDNRDMDATAYYLNESAFIDLIRSLQDEQLQVSSFDDTHIEGTIEVLEDGLFFLSIPYDPGWTLYVDGVKTEYYKFKEAFLSCDLTPGTHQIRLTYRPDGFIPGLMITLAALALLILFLIFRKRLAEKWQEYSEARKRRLEEEADSEDSPDESEDNQKETF